MFSAIGREPTKASAEPAWQISGLFDVPVNSMNLRWVEQIWKPAEDF